MRHLSPSPGFRLRSIVVTRIIFFWPWPRIQKIGSPSGNFFCFVATSSPKFKPPILPSMIHDSWIFMIQTFQESFPPFPSFFPPKNSHLSTTLAACCPPPKRFTSDNTVGQHTTLQIATFWGWLAIYFHSMVYIPISEIVHYKWTQTKKIH